MVMAKGLKACYGNPVIKMVKVKYGEPYRTSFGKSEDKINAKTLGDLMKKVGDKYKDREHAGTIEKYSLILLNNSNFIGIDKKDYKLKPKDEVLIMQMLSGG